MKSINGSYDVNSVIVDFSIEPAPAKLNPPLVVEFQHLSVSIVHVLLNKSNEEYFMKLKKKKKDIFY